jgi:hypothetical protein
MNKQQILNKLNLVKIKLNVAIKLGVRKLMRKFVMIMLELEAMLEQCQPTAIKYTSIKYHAVITIWCNLDMTQWGFSAIRQRPNNLPFSSLDKACKEARSLVKRLIKTNNNTLFLADVIS